ncbi:MAG: hypothetical protein AAF725_06235 [Acidobacteriota bacterium]
MVQRFNAPRPLLVILILLVTLALQLPAIAQPAPGVRTATSTDGAVLANPGGNAIGVPGTIMYDNNTPFDRDPTLAGTVGNRFDTQGDPHSITTVSFALAGNYGASALVSVWDVNTGAGSAMLLVRQQVLGLANSPAATQRFTAMLTTPITNRTGPFIAGIRNSSFSSAPYLCGLDTGLASTCDGVALTEGTTDPGSGFQGARVNWVGTGMFIPSGASQVSSLGADFGDTNAIFRATGNNLPVELMAFSVE